LLVDCKEDWSVKEEIYPSDPSESLIPFVVDVRVVLRPDVEIYPTVPNPVTVD
jgi:hypothetical protein